MNRLRAVFFILVLAFSLPSASALTPVELCADQLVPSGPDLQLRFESAISTSTPDAAILTLRSIARGVQLGRVTADTFAHLDIVRPLLGARAHFTPAQRDQMVDVLAGLEAIDSTWRNVVRPLRVLFEPDLAPTLIPPPRDNLDLSHEFSVFPGEINRGTITALANLPEPIRTLLRHNVRDQMMALWRQQGPGRLVRKNKEIILRALYENEFQDLIHALASAQDQSSMVRLVDTYWRQFNPQGNYSFQTVLDVARLVQGSGLTGDDITESMYLYGSFVNGKARFPGSDVDAFLSLKLDRVYQSAFGVNGSFVTPTHMRPVPFDLSARFIALEEQIAARLGLGPRFGVIPRYRPSWLLVIQNIAESNKVDGLPFSYDEFALHNSFLIRITRHAVYLQIFDAFGTQKLFELRVL